MRVKVRPFALHGVNPCDREPTGTTQSGTTCPALGVSGPFGSLACVREGASANDQQLTVPDYMGKPATQTS